ncbi:quinon protein alcohol dehydrogenase-like superfamily [Gongronella butleri]|nr:quinon protein alcohol dehydrogenase-like superfamily [Gongronella butleri]
MVQSVLSAEKARAKHDTKQLQQQQQHLSVVRAAGGNMCQTPLSFTTDSRYFFTGVGCSIKIYSIATGAVVKVLSPPNSAGAHQDKVTAVVLNPDNPLQLISASMDGTIKIWDYNDEVLLRTFQMGGPVKQLILSPAQPDYAYILVTPPGDALVYQVHLDLSSPDAPHTRLIAEIPACHHLAVSSDDTYLAMAARFKFFVWPVNRAQTDVNSSQLRSYTVREGVTKVAFNPTKNYLAVGQRTGRITFFHCFTDETKDKPVLESHHWHYKPVEALQFMIDGNYLLSGGSEAVLVAWQLETGYRRYFPRLGGPIQHISITPDHKHFAVSLANNSIRFINGVTQVIDQVIQGVQQPSSSLQQQQQQPQQIDQQGQGDGQQAAMWSVLTEPRHQHLVLNASAGGIQFYDGKMDRHVLDLEVIPNSNNTRGSGGDRGHVSHVSFSSNGDWLATVDVCDDKINAVEVFLKFWRWDHDQQTYVLHTRVDSPHTSHVTSLAFHPSTGMAITTSQDKTFKVWTVQSAGDDLLWTCRSVGSYKDMIPSASGFSLDGSLLIVAFGSLLTAWDPVHSTVQATLATPEHDTILSVQFINDSPFLVARTASHLFVWNILACTVWWSYEIATAQLAVDPCSLQFAVVTGNTVVLFDPASPKPLLIHTLDAPCLGITWQRADPKETARNDSCLMCLQPNGVLQALAVTSLSSSSSTVADMTEQQDVTMLDANAGANGLLDGTFGKRAQRKAKQADDMQERINAIAGARDEWMDGGEKTVTASSNHNEHATAAADLLNAPAHVLPGLDAMYDAFMASLMKLRVSDDDNQAKITTNGDAMDWVNDQEQQNVTVSSSVAASAPASMPFTLDPLPSLDTLFRAGQNDATITTSASALTADASDASSDDDNDDSDDDVDNIEW